jgi:transcriptional regulator with XRE-family HTH domain
MNTAKLKGKMKELNITQEELAKLLGKATSTVNRKLQNNGESFTVGEVQKITAALHLTNEEANLIFLPEKSQLCDRKETE